MKEVAPTAGEYLFDFPCCGCVPLPFHGGIPRFGAHKRIEVAIIFLTLCTGITMHTALAYGLTPHPKVLGPVDNFVFPTANFSPPPIVVELLRDLEPAPGSDLRGLSTLGLISQLR
jgi:hypothetical protein